MRKSMMPILLAGIYLSTPPQAFPATAPAATQPDAAALVREIRAQEAWIDHVKSFQLTATSHWSLTPEGLAYRRAQLKKQFPTIAPTTQNFHDLTPAFDHRLVLGFDDHRAYERSDNESGPGTFDMRFWDGKRAVSYFKYGPKQPAEYALKSDAEPLQFLLLNLVWPRQSVHHFWFVPPEQQMDEDFIGGRPEDFQFSGTARVGAIDCFKVNSPLFWRTLYIGVADHHVYRATDRVLPRSGNPRTKQFYADLAATEGKKVASAEEYYAWYKTLPKPTQQALEREEMKRLTPFTVPYNDYRYSDYREIAPGDWMPLRMGYAISEIEANPMFISGRREITITDVKIDQSLPEKWFQIKFQEGLKVNDWAHDPPLFYTYKKNRTPAEWKQIENEAKQRSTNQKRQTELQDKLIGHSAPPFPPSSTWLNSKPLDLTTLKGKVVLLDFFAEWCGPCRNDYPTLVDLSKEKNNGIVVIGVHPPGSKQADIERLLKQFGMGYPVCIDAEPPKGAESWGAMYSAYAIWGIPHSFVIDRKGNVAAHGDLAQTLAAARSLAAQ